VVQWKCWCSDPNTPLDAPGLDLNKYNRGGENRWASAQRHPASQRRTPSAHSRNSAALRGPHLPADRRHLWRNHCPQAPSAIRHPRAPPDLDERGGHKR
jgi:hypothetical protein